jgi:cytochrome c peroxidase
MKGSMHYLIHTYNKSIYFLFIGLIFLCSCNKPEPAEPDFNATPYTIQIPTYFPTILNIPDDNPMTVEGVKLGRYLFYDGRLRGYSGNNEDSLMSCSTCHIQAYGFECGIDHPKYKDGKTFGINGKPTPHSMMPLCNLVFNNNGYFWNGMIYKDNPQTNRRNIEDIVSMGILAEHEMNSSIERTVACIKNISIYPPMFKAAFGTEEVTIERIEKALAQFLRTLISGNSKFDRYIRGEEQLTPDELQGFILFTTEEGADCFHCHGSDGNLLMTTNDFYNNGLDSVFNDSRDRYAVTGNSMDRGVYRAPSLRNIEVTAPYMHDGRFKTLDEVIDFYSQGLQASPYVHPLMHKIADGGALLTPKEKRQLKAFLLSLTDNEFLTNPAYAKPDDLP